MYKALNKLYSEHQHAGLEILGFPSREFGGQEFETGPEIAKFVKGKGVEFQMMELSKVNPGNEQNPVHKFLMEHTSNKEINWNFSTTFLIGRDGEVHYRIDKNWDIVVKKVEQLLDVPGDAPEPPQPKVDLGARRRTQTFTKGAPLISLGTLKGM